MSWGRSLRLLGRLLLRKKAIYYLCMCGSLLRGTCAHVDLSSFTRKGEAWAKRILTSWCVTEFMFDWSKVWSPQLVSPRSQELWLLCKCLLGHLPPEGDYPVARVMALVLTGSQCHAASHRWCQGWGLISSPKKLSSPKFSNQKL